MNETKQKIGWLERSVSFLAWICFFLAVITAIITVLAVFSGEQNGKEVFGAKLLIVTSNSMSKSELTENEEITFSAGDVIVIEVIDDPNELNAGDVITFTSENPESYGKTVTHKIRKAKYSADGKLLGFVTYGVNTGANDMTMVKPENVIGRYVFKITGAGKLFGFLKTERGFYLSVMIPSVLLIIFFSVRVGKALATEKNITITSSDDVEDLKKRVSALEKLIKQGAFTGTAYPRGPTLDHFVESNKSVTKTNERITVKLKPIKKQGDTATPEESIKITSVMSPLPPKKPIDSKIKFTVSGVMRSEGNVTFVVSKEPWEARSKEE